MLDLACNLIGVAPLSAVELTKKSKAAAAVAAAGEGASSMAEAGAAAAMGAWPALLPYMVGLPPPAASTSAPATMSWRRLHAVAVSSGVVDCTHGYAAAGLPPGTVATVLTGRSCKMRVSTLR